MKWVEKAAQLEIQPWIKEEKAAYIGSKLIFHLCWNFHQWCFFHSPKKGQAKLVHKSRQNQTISQNYLKEIDVAVMNYHLYLEFKHAECLIKLYLLISKKYCRYETMRFTNKAPGVMIFIILSKKYKKKFVKLITTRGYNEIIYLVVIISRYIMKLLPLVVITKGNNFIITPGGDRNFWIFWKIWQYYLNFKTFLVSYCSKVKCISSAIMGIQLALSISNSYRSWPSATRVRILNHHLR